MPTETHATSFRLTPTTVGQIEALVEHMNTASRKLASDLPVVTYSKTDAIAHAIAMTLARYEDKA